MPPHVNLERVIGAAVIDREFCTALLRSPRSATASFKLSDEELALLESADASTLEELALHVYAWIDRMPGHRSATPRRRSFEGPQSARAAV